MSDNEHDSGVMQESPFKPDPTFRQRFSAEFSVFEDCFGDMVCDHYEELYDIWKEYEASDSQWERVDITRRIGEIIVKALEKALG